MQAVRASVDILQVLDRIIENIDRARMLLGTAGDGGFLEKKAIIFASCKAACAASIAEAKGDAGAPMDRSTGLLGRGSADAWARDPFGHTTLGVTSIIM